MKPSIEETCFLVLVTICLLSIWALTGMLDADDHSRQLNTYCSNVADGTWPDYNNDFDELCKGWKNDSK